MADQDKQGSIKTGNIENSTGVVIGHNSVSIVIVHQGKEIAIPGPQAVTQHRAELHRQLEANAQERWGGMGAYIQEEGARLPIEASPYQAGVIGPREDLQGLLRRADRLLVLGEPGSGKTVALQRLAWDLCAAPQPVIPVLVELFKYAGAPLAEVVLAGLREPGCLPLPAEALEPFLLAQETPRCVFLFDGLNEVAPPYRDRLVEQVTLWQKSYPRHAAILTSRSQDQLWRRLRDEAAQAVLIQPIRDEQARAYLAAHLPERGAALYDGLDPRLRALARTPFLLWLIKEAGQQGPVEPGNRADLYKNFVARMLARKDWYTGRDMDATDPSARKRATPEQLQTALTHLAYHLGQRQARACVREEAYQVVAAQLQNRALAEETIDTCARAGLLAGKETVWFAPHQTVQEHFAARALAAMAQEEQRLNLGQRLKRGVRRWAGKEDGLAALAAADWWMESFVQLAGLAADPNWLAREVVRVNPWLAWWCVEEGRAVDEKTRAQIEKRSIRLLQPASPVAVRRRAVQTLAQIKSERGLPILWAVLRDEAGAEISQLALQALAEQGEAARQLVEKALHGNNKGWREWRTALRYLRLMPDNLLWAEIPEKMWEELLGVADRCLAIQALARIKSESAMQRLWTVLCDEADSEVVQLAAQALAEQGETVHLLVEKALHGKDRREWRAAVRYLWIRSDEALVKQIPWEKILGQPLVWVPPGPFLMGSDKGRDPQAGDDELPQHELTLPGYWIGRYPVTEAQWRAFVDESGYKSGGGSLKDPDDHPVRYVSWGNAMAYCRWWSKKSGLALSLPSEAEWEKAASWGAGVDGRPPGKRIYPWGDEFDSQKCNTSESGIRTTTPVGKYSPQGDSPYGCVDMAGNLWEWTRSKFKPPYPYNAQDGRESLDGKAHRVVRGGSWGDNRVYARAANRYWYDPGFRDDYCGFRLLVRPPSL